MNTPTRPVVKGGSILKARQIDAGCTKKSVVHPDDARWQRGLAEYVASRWQDRVAGMPGAPATMPTNPAEAIDIYFALVADEFWRSDKKTIERVLRILD